MKRATLASTLMLALGLAMAPAALAADIEVANPFMRAAPLAGGSGAAFMTIRNHGAADRLVGAEAGISKSVELHTHVKDGDIFRMRKVEALDLPAHGAAELKPGGDHIMFIGLNAPMKEGGSVPLTLRFEKAGSIKVDVPVMAAGAMTPGAMMQHGGKH